MTWPNNGLCHCTDAELGEVGSMDDDEMLAYSHVSNSADIALVRLACHRVLSARARAVRPVSTKVEELRALGAGRRWGRRGSGVAALDYIARNVLGPSRVETMRLRPPKHVRLRQRTIRFKV